MASGDRIRSPRRQPVSEVDNRRQLSFRAFADPGETVNLHIGERLEEADFRARTASRHPRAAVVPIHRLPSAEEVNSRIQNCAHPRACRNRSHATKQYSHPHFSQDDSVCHLESIHRTKLYEENLDNGVLKRTPVEVREASFILQNITPGSRDLYRASATSSIRRPYRLVPRRRIPSITVSPSFAVHASPGQTVRFHVSIALPCREPFATIAPAIHFPYSTG